MALVCRALPHELGDFAVLTSTGMKVKKALLLNLVSALAAFLGVYVGIGAGDLALPARVWVLVVAAGIFLYVALAVLIPELVRYFRHYGNARMFVAQSGGMLAGFALMFVLVLVERRLQF
ncbi:zinc transporter ZIP6-like [Babylonia areolata]|uniref:zinc transporter ZIP6-like n=1 Tax=Babylonia areolata TaxID=304850 RepID=UPI003FD3BED8